jgi:hypothetical protein
VGLVSNGHFNGHGLNATRNGGPVTEVSGTIEVLVLSVVHDWHSCVTDVPASLTDILVSLTYVLASLTDVLKSLMFLRHRRSSVVC